MAMHESSGASTSKFLDKLRGIIKLYEQHEGRNFIRYEAFEIAWALVSVGFEQMLVDKLDSAWCKFAQAPYRIDGAVYSVEIADDQGSPRAKRCYGQSYFCNESERTLGPDERLA